MAFNPSLPTLRSPSLGLTTTWRKSWILPGQKKLSTPGRGKLLFQQDSRLIDRLKNKQWDYRLGPILQQARRQYGPRVDPSASKNGELRKAWADAKELAENEIRWLLETVRHKMYERRRAANPDQKEKWELDEMDREARRQLIQGVMSMCRKDQPLAYVIGQHPFSSLPRELLVRPPTLIPRTETEEWATRVAQEVCEKLYESPDATIRILDACTGSGCIAILLAHRLMKTLHKKGSARWHITAFDVSPQAVELARQNAERMGIPPSQLRIVEADLFSDEQVMQLAAPLEDLSPPNAAASSKGFDLIVSNPPYISLSEWEALDPSVKNWEDKAALVGLRNLTEVEEAKGAKREKDLNTTSALDFYRRLRDLLAKPGFLTDTQKVANLPTLVTEVGRGAQADRVRNIFYTPPFVSTSESSEPGEVEKNPSRSAPRRVINFDQTKFLISGLGNYTHPLTRHSAGTLVLDFLVHKLHYEWDRRRKGSLMGPVSDAKEAEAEGDEPVDSQMQGEETHPRSDAPKGLEPIVFHKKTRVPCLLAYCKFTKGWKRNVTLLIDPRYGKGVAQPKDQVRLPDDLPLVAVHLVIYKPMYFMNLSGEGIKRVTKSHNIKPENVMILHDELSKPFGRVSSKLQGSPSGHKGVWSVVNDLKLNKGKETSDIQLARVRIGIGKPEDETDKGVFKGHRSTADWVLTRFKDEEITACVWRPEMVKLEERSKTKSWRSRSNLPLPKLEKGEVPPEGYVVEATFREMEAWLKEKVREAIRRGELNLEPEEEGDKETRLVNMGESWIINRAIYEKDGNGNKRIVLAYR
ncbi:S-adenosyl-L-methionine-dependent methyltransferase [Violaceomyces palustris]|uniref:S-adenosyl-L-methionine-dependent methyltransferase n=1 Tax=Violaceomyces palustris TaxID=1673888 RepID=A0ACD0NMB6_9BASI|nr:S-adenosyl-L-methionine-dependent methyltransferase [Violaceomyces palustris]